MKKILCVDDEMDVLLILKTALSEDYEVSTAGNGIDAIALVDDLRPDLVILDMMMPEMDGIQTLRELRQTEAGADVPVLFLTGVSDKEVKRQALDLGTSYYLTKPFDYNDLISKVEIAIKSADSDFP